MLLAAGGAPWQFEAMPDEADLSRLPRFETGNADYDAFVNEYYLRHLSVDERGVYFPTSVAPGLPDQLWVTEWDAWFLAWVDRAAMGLRRNQGNRLDMPRFTLANIPVDRHGYAYGARLFPEPNEHLGGWRAMYVWPWPKYNRNSLATRPSGWEFNGETDPWRDEWRAEAIELAPGYVDHRLVGSITGAGATLTSPAFDCDAFQVPLIELDLEFGNLAGRDPLALLDGLRIEWITDDEPEFAPERSVGIAFASLPPRDYPEPFAPWVGPERARYPLYFPVCDHPGWGRGGRRITGLRLRLPDAPGVSLALNYLRASYDVRLSTSNSSLIRAAAEFYGWSGDQAFLRHMMPRLRRAMLFLLVHLKGEDGLLSLDWFVGHDGLGGPDPGHGLIGSYWDLLPAGRIDLESTAEFVDACAAMARLEDEATAGRGAPATVDGPDGRPITRTVTAAQLREIASRARRAAEQLLWDEAKGRFARNHDIKGIRHDYGFVHANLMALVFGIGTPAQRDRVLTWLDGRVIDGDTSTGADIYRWRFAPRTSTVANESYYFWPWVEGRRERLPLHEFGNQMQDGGAIPLTSLLELMVRCSTRRQAQIDRAYERTLAIRDWYREVQAAGGEGTEFYRAYYNNHPERGLQQGGGPPGGLGLDREFLSDAALGTTFLFHAFLGARAEGRTLVLSPVLPTALDHIAVENVIFRGARLRIEAGRGFVTFRGSEIPPGSDLRARLTLPLTGRRLLIDGRETPYERVTDPLVIDLPLRAVRVELR